MQAQEQGPVGSQVEVPSADQAESQSEADILVMELREQNVLIEKTTCQKIKKLNCCKEMQGKCSHHCRLLLLKLSLFDSFYLNVTGQE